MILIIIFLNLFLILLFISLIFSILRIKDGIELNKFIKKYLFEKGE